MIGLVAFVAAAGLLAACGGGPPSPERSPNVLLVVFDTTRDDYVGRHDLPAPTTPNVDRLAAEGVRFTNAYSVANWTVPAHGSLFTGRYPSETGAHAESMFLPDDEETLAERLRDAGWITYGASANPWIAHERGYTQGFDEYLESWRSTPARPPGPAAAEVATFVREHANGERPFFAFLNLNTPHLPYTPSNEAYRTFVDPSWSRERVLELGRIKGFFKLLVGERTLSERDFEILARLYAAEIWWTDRMLGEILDALRETGTLDDTIVIVTSDHGENLGEHGEMGHGLCRHETTLRVPLVVRYPARFEPGGVRDELVSLVDVMPTVLDVTGTATDAERARIEAASLARTDRTPRSFVVAETARPVLTIEELNRNFPDFDASPYDHRTRVVREGRYKLIWDVGRRTRLFDLDADPGELVDLQGTLPEVERRLLERLRDWMAAVTPREDLPRHESDDAETLERLRSLGYLE